MKLSDKLCQSAFLLILILTGCASSPTIVANRAPDFNVANYKTFSFMDSLGSDRGGARSLLSQHLISAATNELELEGLRHTESGGDLLVNFIVSTRETLSTRSSPNTGMSMHHGRGRYGTWSGYSMSMSTTEVVQRTEGTIGVDIIDASINQLVWEGAATGRVTDSVRQNMEQVSRDAVADMFLQFP